MTLIAIIALVSQWWLFAFTFGYAIAELERNPFDEAKV